MQLFTFWYNELDGDKNWLSKNVILAIMYGCMELGGTLSAGVFFYFPPFYDHPAGSQPLSPRMKGAIPLESAKLENSLSN